MANGQPADDQRQAAATGRSAPHSARDLLQPVVLIALAILLAIFVLILFAIMNWDKGHVLNSMSQIEFARGLITYLFAVVTIGTAVVLVVSALTASEQSAEYEKRFNRGKEVLALLLGVFGTIVGFYFGREVAAKGQPGEAVVNLVPIRLSASSVISGGTITVSTYVSGGKAPFRYGIGFDKDALKALEPAGADGWIVKTIAAPKVGEDQAKNIYVLVEDADGHSAETSIPVLVKPSQ